MRELLPKPQRLPQRGAGREHIQNSSIGRFQIGTQHQTRNQLALSKIMPTAGSAVIGQMWAAQLHCQFSYLLDRRTAFCRLAHKLEDCAPKKRFLQSTSNFQLSTPELIASHLNGRSKIK